MKEKKPYDPRLVAATINNFIGSEDIYYIWFKTLFPYEMAYRLYLPYSIGAAAVDAMIDDGFTALEIASNLDLKDRILEQAWDVIEADGEIDVQTITQERELLADEKNKLINLVLANIANAKID